MDANFARHTVDRLRSIWEQTAKLALDIALPTQCVSCREPVEG